MSVLKSKISRESFSKEGQAMNAAFKQAVKKAKHMAFSVRKTIMVEKNGWLVMVNKDGKVMRKVRKVESLQLIQAS